MNVVTEAFLLSDEATDDNPFLVGFKPGSPSVCLPPLVLDFDIRILQAPFSVMRSSDTPVP